MAAFDVEGARKEGYNDSQIAEFLAKQNRFNLQGARREGHSDTDIVSFLTGSSKARSVPGSEGAPDASRNLGKPNEEGFLTRARGAVEAAGNLLVAPVAAAVGGAGGALGAAAGAVRQGEFGTPAAAGIKQGADEGAARIAPPEPQTQTGQAILETAGRVADDLKLPAVGPTNLSQMGQLGRAGSVAAQRMAPAAEAVAGKVAAAVPRAAEPKPILNAAAITEANKAGYVIPPSQAGGGMISRALEGFSGKIKTAQKASQVNAETTNKLVRQAMNIAPDQPITSEALQNIRTKAGQSYEQIKAIPSIKATPEFKTKVAELGGDFKAAAKEFPELLKNEDIEKIITSLSTPTEISGQAAIEVVKKLRADATANLKAFDKPERRALGYAQRKAAEAVDGLIEQNLRETGNKGLVEQYRKDRQAIAKSYDVEAALNDQTGNVSALYLARLADKGRPLTGELKQVAKFAEAFPKAAQDLEKIGSLTELSVLDYATGGLASLASGHIGAAAAVATRPAIRAGILSKPYQNMLAKRAAKDVQARPERMKREPATKKETEQQIPLRSLLESESAQEQQPLKKAVGE